MHATFKKGRFAKILGAPEAILVGSFGGAILLGTLLLRLPWSHETGRIGIVDALFTATSAVCVTGLVVADTGKDYTLLGQIIIMILIQAGGLGIMTFAALAFQIAGLRLSLQSQALVSDTFFQRDMAGQFQRTFKTILILTIIMETLGALLLFVLLRPSMGWREAVFASIFHSISAFCNAGFSTFSESLIPFKGNAAVVFVIMSLIVLGGLGYIVLHEISDFLWRYRRDTPHFSLHTRVVLVVTPILIFGGACLLIIFGLTGDENSWIDKILAALFQSVTARTAGFNSVDIGQLPAASLFTLIILMFIGGSPASCAGGVKTTSLAIWLAMLVASLYGRKEVRLMNRRLSPELIDRTSLLLGLAVFWNLVGIFLLLSVETHMPGKALDLIFEQVSAFGTVGLSTGVTPNLSTVGKLWIVLTMFMGRLGPLTVSLWMFPREAIHVSYPKGTVMVG